LGGKGGIRFNRKGGIPEGKWVEMEGKMAAGEKKSGGQRGS